MEKLGGEDKGRRTSIREVVTASFAGTAIEWYDFFIYGTAAALVFNQLFFPTFDPLAGTLAAFATFAVGFFARPVGGIVAGHYGDRVGRKAVLVATMLVMGFATFLIGFLPTYDSIGVLAPILLVALRFLQGLAVGGEWGGAVIMAVEYAPDGKRGLYGAWPHAGVPAGLLLSLVAFASLSGLSEEQFLSWGWRIPFMLSIVLVGVGMFVRLRIMESPVFARVRESGTQARMPVLEVLRRYPRNALLATGTYLGANVCLYIFIVFIIAYVTTHLGLPRGVILNGVLIGSAMLLAAILASGALSDRVGRRTVCFGGATFMALYAFPFFWLVDTRQTSLIWFAVAVGFGGCGFIVGPIGAYFSELFGTRTRYSGASLGYQLGSVLGGGMAPFIATVLLARSGGASWPVATYMLAALILTLVSLYLLPETLGEEISEDRLLEDDQTNAALQRGGKEQAAR